MIVDMMHRKFLRVVIVVFLLTIISLGLYRTKTLTDQAQHNPTPTGDLQRFETTSMDVFDSLTQITLYAENKASFDKESKVILEDLKNYHALYDIYNDYPGLNNLKTVNDHAGVQPVVVDQKIIDLLEYSKKIYATTNGKTNVAMGSVLSIWHRYREEGLANPADAQLPPMEELKAASHHTDIDSVVIDNENSTVFLEDPEIRLDVGAIAKGYAAEMVVQNAKESGTRSLLLSLGGNVRVLGAKPNGKPWIVGIQNPSLEDQDNTLAEIRAVDTSLVTSGNYQRYYTVAGNNYNHVIDPKTLMPASYYNSVSVITEHSGMADALSTALFCMPYEEGRLFAEKQKDVQVFWVFKDGSTAQTQGFKKLTEFN
jgi:thiamine biosynthesis lipoprotein